MPFTDTNVISPNPVCTGGARWKYLPPQSLIAIISSTFAAMIMIRYARSPWRKLPPGPRGIPILGNVLQLLGETPWRKFAKWKDTYGPIMYLNIVGQPVVILNTLKAAADLLDRKANVSSGRYKNLAADIATGEIFLPFLQPEQRIFSHVRKGTQESFRNPERFRDILFQENLSITRRLLAESGKNWYDQFLWTTSSSMMSIVYGRSPNDAIRHDSVRKLHEFVKRMVHLAMPGTHMVDIFPWLRNVPPRFASWKRKAQQAFIDDSKVLKEIFDKHQTNHNIQEASDRYGLSETEIHWLAAALFVGGAEGPAAALAWWMIAMVEYPETQRRAQEELDRVVGRGKLPTFSDRESLPYMNAMVKEACRWGQVDPLGLPHAMTKDTWESGYFIPKGTILIPNVWAINRDPSTYGPDAHHFRPERYLDPNTGRLAPSLPDTKGEGHVTFGFGRRICPGRHIAGDMLFISIATVLWALKFEPKREQNGNKIPIDVEGVIWMGATM